MAYRSLLNIGQVRIPQITYDDETRDLKRLKLTPPLSRLNFRDHIWTYTQRYHEAEAVEEAAEAMINARESSKLEEEATLNGMKLVQLLIACAEAVACRDKSHSSALLSELRANALVFGSAFQRVASCFVQGLSDRVGTLILTEPKIASDKNEETIQLAYEICPYIQFGHYVANSLILEAFEGEDFVHVVDLGMNLDQQWRHLIRGLAIRPGKPPNRIRITAIGLSEDKPMGDGLEAYAKKLGINLEFAIVSTALENLQPDQDIIVTDSEVVVVNSILQLHSVVKESRGALNTLLKRINLELSPKVMVILEQDSSHNGPFFLGRFMEALHYYSAIFDSLDAVLPKHDTRRAKVEQFYFGEEIKNIVSCEGAARVERHERVDQWRRRMTRAGFQGVPIKIMGEAKKWLGENVGVDEFTVVEEKGCLVLGWKSKPIVAASCWKC